ncbi:MAG: hypothetical protein ABSB24_11490 [Gaiellaceae bacterium]|jgi:hypothetical protein
MILLVRQATDDGAPVRILDGDEAAADILRAFGGDSALLDTNPGADPQPNTP